MGASTVSHSLMSTTLIVLAILSTVIALVHKDVHLHHGQFHHAESAISAGSESSMIHNVQVLGTVTGTSPNAVPTLASVTVVDSLPENDTVDAQKAVATAAPYLELKIRALETPAAMPSTKVHRHVQHHQFTGSEHHHQTYKKAPVYIRPTYTEAHQMASTKSAIASEDLNLQHYDAETVNELNIRSRYSASYSTSLVAESGDDAAENIASSANPMSKFHQRDAPQPTESMRRCPTFNGTTFTSAGGQKYETTCGINIPGQDLPFQSVDSFEACVAACDSTNGDSPCVAMVFVPNRLGKADDCYLKYGTSNQISTDTPIEGAILVSFSEKSSFLTSRAPSSVSTAAGPVVTYARGNSIIAPRIAYQKLHGPTQNHPATQYIKYQAPTDITLPKNLLTVGVIGGLTTNYGVSLDTGVLQINSSTQDLLTDLSEVPHFSRDGGKGGVLNGQQIFVFCDTGAYSPATPNRNGNFLGFVSSSVATDTGMNALFGNPIYLQDGIGQFSDDAGRLRGFSPITQGEMGYNLVMQGQGQRYAVWPESSIIPLSGNSALLYAPIIYDNVNQATRAATFTYSGNTLLTVTAGGQEGPVAQRTVNRLFNEGEVEWGCVGGIRSWGPSGIGGTDGKVYLFGNVRGGILLARTDPDSVADRNSYEYWTGNSWSHGMQPSNSQAYFISGAFMDVDVFYSPRHLTFIIVYMNIYADSTFYYRYLQAPQAIRPPYAGGDQSSDYVENILQHPWSEEQVLYKSEPGLTGRYTYAGGVHAGYFYADDITNGGRKMLLSWTAPTGQDPASVNSEYQIVTAEVDWA